MKIRLVKVDVANGIPNKPILIEAEGQGWYYGATKSGQGTYIKTRWVSFEEYVELNESTTLDEAADSIIKVF